MNSNRAFNFPGSAERPTHWLIRWLVGLLLASVLSACAVAERMVPHSFGFDIRRSVPAVEVLDYRYGDSGLPGTRRSTWALNNERGIGQSGINGSMRVADSLYVKWRIEGTGEVFEQTVDLKSRLPRDIAEHKIYFDIQGSQLYVYLVSMDVRRPADSPMNGPRIFHHLQVRTLYPDSL